MSILKLPKELREGVLVLCRDIKAGRLGKHALNYGVSENAEELPVEWG